MAQYQYEFRISRALDYAILMGAICFSAYWYLRPVFYPEHFKPKKVIRSQAREVAMPGEHHPASALSLALPYPTGAFPGARDVDTAYGTIRAYEWGPGEGEKVLLVHGIGTPCIALGDMARQFVKKGYRVMLFDLFGRGYSDSPSDLIHDDRLYTTQILLVLASSCLAWTGISAFHIVGYSLGGGLAASFAAHHTNLLRSVTLICPGGLVRRSHVSFKSRLLYSEGILPLWLANMMGRRQLEPKPGAPSADVPDPAGALDEIDGREAQSVDFNQVPICAEDASGPTVGDVVKWQLSNNEGFVPSYMSAIRHAPIYEQHEGVWKLLSRQLLARRRDKMRLPGLPGGKICLILADRDPIVVKDEWIADSFAVLGRDAVDIRVVKGGHEIAISKGREVADVAIAAWTVTVD
ncbi:hypothetical protein QQS21_008337 [Conoideocrella luteorostrata]|uniref:AB hydrolase-1 domain-containing protein n=1 Tax=Conoideocrella luteorostrata TaxID=1105319 RepID=A0AAJ0CJ25_9HYPO|nr:hypothetical protein QQS21_008337 [Conoideocrella luteorostrata]